MFDAAAAAANRTSSHVVIDGVHVGVEWGRVIRGVIRLSVCCSLSGGQQSQRSDLTAPVGRSVPSELAIIALSLWLVQVYFGGVGG